jgi:hypothetical protein
MPFPCWVGCLIALACPVKPRWMRARMGLSLARPCVRMACPQPRTSRQIGVHAKNLGSLAHIEEGERM